MTAKNVDETTVSATRCAPYRRSQARPARRASHILMFCGALREKCGMSYRLALVTEVMALSVVYLFAG